MTQRQLQWLVKALCVCAFASFNFAMGQDPETMNQDTGSAENAQPAPEKKRYFFGTLELPVGGYELSQFNRYVGESTIHLRDLVSRFLLTFTSNSPLDQSLEEHLLQTYEIRKVRHLVSVKTAHTYLFEYTGKNPTAENPLEIVKRLYNDANAPTITSASPVFRFSDEPHYLTGKIVIEWGPRVSIQRAGTIVGLLKLSVDSFEEKTRIMIVSPTKESGYNVFALADAFSPQEGNAFAVSVEPQFAAFTSPVRVSASLAAGDGKGYGSNIAGSLFRYTLTVWAQKNATVRVHELRETSAVLKKWLPVEESESGEPKPVFPQVFTLEGPADIRERLLEGVVREYEITYAFRMYQAGTFRLAPPPVLYAVTDTQQRKPVIEQVEGSPVPLFVSSVLPDEATMVNGPAGTPAITHVNTLPKADALFEKASLNFRAAWILAGVATLLLGIVFFPRMGHKEIPRTAQALAAWRTHASALAELEPDMRQQFWKDADTALRETVGILVDGDSERFKAAQNPEAIIAALPDAIRPDASVTQELLELLRATHLHQFGGGTEQATDEREQFLQSAQRAFTAMEGGRHAHELRL